MSNLFNLDDKESINEILDSLTLTEIEGGEYLMRLGDTGDSMYILISGRLIALVKDQVGKSIIVGEISRGETVGEMALINEGATRTADICAIRDSVLAKIEQSDFKKLIHKYPNFLLQVSKLVVNRLQNQLTFQKRPNTYVVFSIYDIDQTDKTVDTLERFVNSFNRTGNVKIVRSGEIDTNLSQDKISNTSDEEERNKISVYLNELEAQYDFLLLILEHGKEKWNKVCIRHADYNLVLADTTLGSDGREVEHVFAESIPDSGWNVKMMLVYEKDCPLPNNTIAWYEDRKINGHHHVREGHEDDIKRVTRIVCGKSNGLVLSGGGAKGMAHVGVFKALKEKNISIDYVCGTSIGSIMAALIAMDKSADEVTALSEQVFLNNPTPFKDFNLLPYYGLLSGKKIDKLLQQVFGDVRVEDLWIPYFCVSSDLTNAKIRLHEQGLLWKSIRASISLPGVFPPVIYEKHVLVDGVVFNNIPVDIITQKGVGNVIGVNLSTEEIKEVNVEELPSTLQRWAAKFFRRDKYENLPTMMETIAKSTFAMSENQSREHFNKIDLFFSPPVYHFGLMEWKSFHAIAKIGYDHAIQVLSEKEDLSAFTSE